MLGKKIVTGFIIGTTATAAVMGLGLGYFGKTAPGRQERQAIPEPAVAPPSAPKITIAGKFAKGLSKPPYFRVGASPDPFAVEAEDKPSFLAGARVEAATLEGEVVATGRVQEDGSFALDVPPAPKYVITAKNDMVSVTYGVMTGGLPDMERIANAERNPGGAAGRGEEVSAHGASDHAAAVH